MKILGKRQVLASLLIITGLFSQLNAHCAKCSKIEVERLEQQKQPGYQKNDYYDDYILQKEKEASINPSANKEVSTLLNADRNEAEQAASHPTIISDEKIAVLDTISVRSENTSDIHRHPLNQPKPHELAHSLAFTSTIGDILTMQGIEDIFKNPFTIFVPSDEAIRHFPKLALDKILDPRNRELLFSYVVNHIIPYQILKKDFNKNFKTVGGRNIEIEDNENVLTVNNDAKILKSIAIGNNGILYIVDKVLIPIHEKEIQ